MREQLTQNFFRDEFTCYCGCGFDDISIVVVQNLQVIRDRTGQPLFINCGCRCLEHNNTLKNSKPTSQHILGLAADIRSDYFSPEEIARIAVTLHCFRYGGIGVYNTFTHLDNRGYIARWGKKWRLA